MSDIFTTTRQILKDIFENELNVDKPNLSATAIDFILRHYKQAVHDYLEKDFFAQEKLIKQRLKKSYNLFIKNGSDNMEIDILKYSLKDLKPAFRKELEKSINNCLNLCKTQNINFLNQVGDSLLNYCSNTKLVRTQSSFLEDVLPKKYHNLKIL